MASTESIADAASSAELPRLLLFRVGDSVYGCEVDLVREVVRHARVTRIPGSPPFVRGLLNVRGHVLTVLDVAMRLDDQRPPIAKGSILVVQVGERQAGLIVDEVLHVAPMPRETPGEELKTTGPELVRTLGHLDGRIVLFLNVSTLVNQALI